MAGMPRLPNGLTEYQDEFIRQYFLNGGNGTKAAIAAGYGEEGAAQRAHELLQHPAVLAAMDEFGRDYLSKQGAKSLGVIAQLRDSAKSESVRLAAAQDLANRANARLAKGNQAPRRKPSEMLEEARELVAELQNLLPKPN